MFDRALIFFTREIIAQLSIERCSGFFSFVCMALDPAIHDGSELCRLPRCTIYFYEWTGTILNIFVETKRSRSLGSLCNSVLIGSLLGKDLLTGTL